MEQSYPAPLSKKVPGLHLLNKEINNEPLFSGLFGGNVPFFSLILLCRAARLIFP